MSGALRGKERKIHRTHAEQMQRRKERRIKVKNNNNCDRSYYTTPVHLVSVAGFLQYQVMALMFEHYGILMATFTHKL